MPQTLSHTEVLQAPADEIWDACKRGDVILCKLQPEYFAKFEVLGNPGEPGSIRVWTGGPALPQVKEVKERVDKFDEATKTMGYTTLEGDPRYSSFRAEMQFVPKGETTEAVWTATYEPVGDMGPPEHIKAVAIIVVKTFERFVHSKKMFSIAQTLDISLDALWKPFRWHLQAIFCKALPQVFESITVVQGKAGEPGCIQSAKLKSGSPIESVEHTERFDVLDDATKRMAITVLKGDPRYKYFANTVQYTPGAAESTTDAIWTATYIPEGDMGPPEHMKDMVIRMFKALVDEIKANPEAYA